MAFSVSIWLQGTYWRISRLAGQFAVRGYWLRATWLLITRGTRLLATRCSIIGLVRGTRLLAMRYAVFGHAVRRYWLHVIGYALSATRYRLGVISYALLATRYRLRGYWLRGYWLRVVGYALLATRLLAVTRDGRIVFTAQLGHEAKELTSFRIKCFPSIPWLPEFPMKHF